MTCLVLSEIFPPRIGGSGQWLHELYRRQAPERTVLLVGDYDGAETFDDASKLRIVRADLSGSAWTLMTAPGRQYIRGMYEHVSRLRKLHSLEEIHCARVIPEGVVGWFAATFMRMRLVCFVHGEDIELAHASRESRWLVHRVLTRSSRLVCNSNNTKRMLVEDWGCDIDRIVVLHPGIDTTNFAPSSDPVALKMSLGWHSRPVVLTVSRLEARKGHDKMIDALPALIKQVPDLLYVIVGSGGELEALQARVKAIELEDHVDFLGACNENTLLACLQACDVFVLPNRQVGTSIEGFGIVLLEAQACAKPVIAGDSGGTAETMIPGETGLIVDCTRAENLITPLLDLLNDKSRRETMGDAARQLMLLRFDWKALAEKAEQAVFRDASNSTSSAETQKGLKRQ